MTNISTSLSLAIKTIWLNRLLVYNQFDSLLVFLGIKLCCADVAVFPDLSNYLGDNAITTNRNDGQSYENMTQVQINRNYPLGFFLAEYYKMCMHALCTIYAWLHVL